MRALISKVGRLHPLWLLAAAVLALPDCGFQGPAAPKTNLAPGLAPLSTLIPCEIEKQEVARRCATAEDKAMGIRLAAAAVALTSGQKMSIGLDESPEARQLCGGEPQAVFFAGAFPDGFPVCVNAGQVGDGAPYANAAAACVDQCKDFVGTANDQGRFIPAVPPSADTIAFCNAHARAATNLASAGLPGGCTPAGQPDPAFLDPRQNAEIVIWQDLIGTEATGTTTTTLTRTAPTTTNLDAGAASSQVITRGDAYVELSAAAAAGQTAVGGLSTAMGSDGDPSLNDINFAISLNRDGRFYVIEGGIIIPGGQPNNSFGTYAAGERFRVSLTDNSDGTASVSYSRIVGACVPGAPCTETVFFTRPGNATQYPLRVDASFREQGSALVDVRLVRIQ